MTEREMKQRKAAARKARARKARSRRVLTTVALMLVVCVASIGGTIAWLTDTTPAVTNTFSPSNIKLWMTETVNGEVESTDDPENADGITNPGLHIVPGLYISKDPKVWAESDVDYYVFVKVTAENWPTWTAQNSNVRLVDYSVDTNNWTKLEGETINGITANDTVYYKAMSANSKINGISILKDDKVYVSTAVTKEHLAQLTANNLPKLTFQAYAIQQQNGNATTNAEGNVIDDGKFTALEAWNTLNPASNSGN